MGHELPRDTADRLKSLRHTLPPDTEIARILQHIDEPAHDAASKDRYIGLVAAGAVEQALHQALIGEADAEKGTRPNFGSLIDMAASRGIITSDQAVELHRLREVRNVFAHALLPVSFETPEIAAICRKLWHHPVTDWASYFAPIFPPRTIFAIACGEYFKQILRRSG